MTVYLKKKETMPYLSMPINPEQRLYKRLQQTNNVVIYFLELKFCALLYSIPLFKKFSFGCLKEILLVTQPF